VRSHRDRQARQQRRYQQARQRRASRSSKPTVQWTWLSEATFAPPIGEVVNHRRVLPYRENEEAEEEVRDRARPCVRALDQALTGKEWLLGDHVTGAA